MGLLHRGLTILHFDETYYAQQRLLAYPHENVDFQEIKSVNLYCDERSLLQINSRLRMRKQKGITMIGSGNYHYVTYLLMQEITEPFTLVLFDNHPDLGIGNDQDRPLFSCGSWVYYALHDLPFMEKAVIIGPTYDASVLPKYPQTHIYTYDDLQYCKQSLLSTIPTDNIYISIDKDVLNPNDSSTNWDQGKMDLSILLEFLSDLIEVKEVHGLDICGERRFSQADLLHSKNKAMIQKNERANMKILETCWNVYSKPKEACPLS